MKRILLSCLVLGVGGGAFVCPQAPSQTLAQSNEWRGFAILPPITNANPAVRHPLMVRVPTQLKIQRTADTLSVAMDTNGMESCQLMVGTNMVVGFQAQEFVYLLGEPRPASSREGLAGGLSFGSSTSFYHTKPDRIPQAGRTYVVEMKLEVFETDIPPQHMWNPQGKKYKILWQRTLKSVAGDTSVTPTKPARLPER